MNSNIDFDYLRKHIEPELSSQLDRNTVAHELNSPTKLLTWNRFDIAIKLAYIHNYEYKLDFFDKLYRHHIRAFSLGSYQEYGNESKNSIVKYKEEFAALYHSIRTNGFDKTISIIPIAQDGSIINGSHRAAISIALGVPVTTVELSGTPRLYDWAYFHRRGLSQIELDTAAITFSEFSNNTYLALLWPSSEEFHDEMLSALDNIVYEKELDLNELGIRNVLSICYRTEPWIGSRADNYPGVVNKLVNVFEPGKKTRIIIFQAETIKQVIKIKDELRNISMQGKHSVHITNNVFETRELSNILFNPAGLHFLSNAQPNIIPENFDKRIFLKKVIQTKKIAPSHILIESAGVLELYGLRTTKDIDILVDDRCNAERVEWPLPIDDHTRELKYHGKSQNELIHSPLFHFTFDGVKFLSFAQLYVHKKNRSEAKDLLDLQLMEPLMQKSELRPQRSIAALLRFHRTKLALQSRDLVRPLLMKLHLYRTMTLIIKKLRRLLN